MKLAVLVLHDEGVVRRDGWTVPKAKGTILCLEIELSSDRVNATELEKTLNRLPIYCTMAQVALLQ